jgi:hypothetical protein
MRLKLAVQAEIALPLELAAAGQDTAQPTFCQSDRARKTIWMVSGKHTRWYRRNILVCLVGIYQYVSINHSDGFRGRTGGVKKRRSACSASLCRLMAATHRAAFLASTMQRTAHHSCPLTFAQLSFKVTMRLKTGLSALLSLLSRQK